jgi:hypothetical protein
MIFDTKKSAQKWIDKNKQTIIDCDNGCCWTETSYAIVDNNVEETITTCIAGGEEKSISSIIGEIDYNKAKAIFTR